MTITSPYSPVSFPGSGTTGPFDVPFRLLDKADVIVQRIAIDGTVTTLSEGIGSTQYQITLLSGGITGARFTLTTALAIGERLVVARRTPRTQMERLANLTRFNPEIHEKAFDKATMLIQENESEASSALKFPTADTPGLNQTLPVDTVRANKVLGFDALGQPIVSILTVAQLDNFNQAVIDTQTQAGIATNAANTAVTQAGIATTQANLAIQAVEGIPYRDAIFLTFANSPRTLTNADRGKLFVIDTSGGNFVFNLAQISGLTTPFTIGVRKDSNDANTVTVNRAGTDTIDGLTSYTISSVGGANFIADTDPSPDRWVTASFGATGGEVKDQTFLSGTDFTPGTTTTLTLTNLPIAPSSTAVTISFDGVAQHPSEWSYNPANGTTTFTSPIPLGVSQVYFRWSATSTAIGTPNDGTISFIKLASGLLASVSDLISGVANKLVTASGLKAAAPNMVLQQVYSTLSTSTSTTAIIPTDGTAPQNTEGTALPDLDVTITPKSSNSIIELELTVPVIYMASIGSCIFALFKDNDTSALNASVVSISATFHQSVCLRYRANAENTSARTYKVRYGSSNGVSSQLLATFGSASQIVFSAKEIAQ